MVELAKPFLINFTYRVLRQVALSSGLISSRRFGELTSIAYSRCAKTMAQCSRIKCDVDSSENNQRTMNNNHSAAFDNCMDKVKVMGQKLYLF